MTDLRQNELRARDAISLIMLGAFFCVLAVLVLSGSFWAIGRPHAMIVNIGAGMLMLLVGGGMMWAGKRLRVPLEQAGDPPASKKP